MKGLFYCLGYWAFLMGATLTKEVATRNFWENLAPTRRASAPWHHCGLIKNPKTGEVVDLDDIPF